MDLDSADCSVLLALLDAGVRPKVVQVEVSAHVPVPVPRGREGHTASPAEGSEQRSVRRWSSGCTCSPRAPLRSPLGL